MVEHVVQDTKVDRPFEGLAEAGALGQKRHLQINHISVEKCDEEVFFAHYSLGNNKRIQIPIFMNGYSIIPFVLQIN